MPPIAAAGTKGRQALQSNRKQALDGGNKPTRGFRMGPWRAPPSQARKTPQAQKVMIPESKAARGMACASILTGRVAGAIRGEEPNFGQPGR